MIAAIFLAHWFQLNYLPAQGPWYGGAVWPNVFVVAVLAPAGWVWSRTRFWPLRPLGHALRGLHVKVDALHVRHDEHAASLASLHDKLDALSKEK